MTMYSTNKHIKVDKFQNIKKKMDLKKYEFNLLRDDYLQLTSSTKC